MNDVIVARIQRSLSDDWQLRMAHRVRKRQWAIVNNNNNNSNNYIIIIHTFLYSRKVVTSVAVAEEVRSRQSLSLIMSQVKQVSFILEVLSLMNEVIGTDQSSMVGSHLGVMVNLSVSSVTETYMCILYTQCTRCRDVYHSWKGRHVRWSREISGQCRCSVSRRGCWKSWIGLTGRGASSNGQ